MKNKNEKLLKDFTKYCRKNPNERFFQALRNWMDVEAVCIQLTWESGKETSKEYQDTFFWEENIYNLSLNELVKKHRITLRDFK